MSNKEYDRNVYGLVYSSENVLIKPNIVDSCWDVKYDNRDKDVREAIRKGVCERIKEIT